MQNQFVSQVFNFNHRVLGVIDREKGLLSDKELDYAIKAIDEEKTEFADAHQSQDFVGAVDAAIDLLYFTVGFLCRMGLSDEQVSDCMSAVHEANMEKKLGVQDKRAGEGVADAVKPTDWTGPEERIAAILGD